MDEIRLIYWDGQKDGDIFIRITPNLTEEQIVKITSRVFDVGYVFTYSSCTLDDIYTKRILKTPDYPRYYMGTSRLFEDQDIRNRNIRITYGNNIITVYDKDLLTNDEDERLVNTMTYDPAKKINKL